MENETTFTTIGQAMTAMKKKLLPQTSKTDPTGKPLQSVSVRKFREKQVECVVCKDAGWVIVNNELRKCKKCRTLTIKPNPFQELFDFYSGQSYDNTDYDGIHTCLDWEGKHYGAASQPKSICNAETSAVEWGERAKVWLANSSAPYPGWLVITGPTGSGKTRLAAIVAREVALAGPYGVATAKFSRILGKLRENNFAQFDQWQQFFQNIDLLLIDDIGIEGNLPAYENNWAGGMLDSLLDDRILKMKLTLVTSNFSLAAFFERSPRVARRLEQEGQSTIIELVTSPYKPTPKGGM